MDCRGLDISSVSLGNAFTVTVAGSGTVYEQADFTFIFSYLVICGVNMMKKYRMWLKLKIQEYK